MPQSTKPFATMTAQVKGDGATTVFTFDLLTSPVGLQIAGLSSSGDIPFLLTATNLPSGVDTPFSQDGQTPTVAFGLTHQFVKFTVPVAIPDGQANYFQCSLYF